LTNSSPREIAFTLTKISHTELGTGDPVTVTDNPMPWLEIGPTGATTTGKTVTFKVAGGGMASVVIANSGTPVPDRWEGRIDITSELGPRTLTLGYAAKPDGRWAGKIYSFNQFGDRNLAAWMADRQNNDKLALVQNAFIQKWAAVRGGRIALSEFNAVVSATTTDSWEWPSVMMPCQAMGLGACYLYVSANASTGASNLYQYSDNLDGQPVPSGVVELPIAMDLQLTDATHMSGRIVSSESLQYAGDPAVNLAFSSDPADVSQCSASSPACLIGLDSVEAHVTVGGRYRLPATQSDCSLVPGRTFTLGTLPWLVPGYTRGTTVDPTTNQAYMQECREGTFPIPSTAAADVAHNRSLAGSNPVPDGRARRRKIELVDGALVNADTLYIIFRESFEDEFLGANQAGFPSYGFMMLNRSNAQLTADSFKGNDQTTTVSGGVDLTRDATCTTDMVTRGLGQGRTLTATTASELASVMLNGMPPADTSEPTYPLASVHYLCQQNGLFDQGPMTNSIPTECPAGSAVTYFVFAGTNRDLTTVDCQKDGSCQSVLNGWNNTSIVITDPVWSCQDTSQAFCSEDRTNLTAGKIFYQKTGISRAVFVPLRSAIDSAFRYKTRFVSREGTNIGFTPGICVPNSNQVPYCYDPPEIEEVRDRASCLVALASGTFGTLDAGVRADVLQFLRGSFSYEEEHNNASPTGIITHDGFEQLDAELLVMLGDDAYTTAFNSRFDLAAAAQLSFPGSQFEPGGIDLSGVAGYEMYVLYQSVQYYQMALDRFYALSPYILKSLDPATPPEQSFITQGTVSSYLTRVLRASTQRTRAWSEIGKRYQSFNRPDLARAVLERAYAAAYIESIIVSRLMQKISDAATSTTRDQIVAEINDGARTYKAALLQMREVYSSFTDQLNYFGFAPDYIPFPALDPDGPNAFQTLLATANQLEQTAAAKEDLAISSNRAYETDEASFQAQLVQIRNNYENQLAQICGTFTGDDGQVYPAIRKYAAQSTKWAPIGDPCGLVGNGDLFDAMGQVDLKGVDAQGVSLGYDQTLQEIQIERDRANAECGLALQLADYRWQTETKVNDLQSVIDSTKSALDYLTRQADFVKDQQDLLKCIVVAGTADGTDCPEAIAASLVNGAIHASVEAANVISDAIISDQQNQISDLQMAEAYWETGQHQCDVIRADFDARAKELALKFEQLHLEALKADYTMQTALGDVERLRNQATQLMAEQEESEQLEINLEAAKNDPNVRIYKNDAIITADRTFYAALGAAYKATKVYEYTTSQSYAHLDDLFLVRLVSRGDFSLEGYLADLTQAYADFTEQNGLPENRLDIISVKDDVLAVPRYAQDGHQLSQGERNELFRNQIQDPKLLDGRGYLVIPFATSLKRVSPITRNHKILYIEAEIIGQDNGDDLGRVYVNLAGTATNLGLDDKPTYYQFPARTSVVNSFFNGVRLNGASDIYRSDRLRDRPYVNSNWEIVLNQVDELVNKDINLKGLTDIRLYIHYTDLTTTL
jgi:hypothetical protein